MTCTVLDLNPVFTGTLSKKNMLSLPEGTVIVSNVGYSPEHPVLVHEVGNDESRKASWDLIKQRNVNGRSCQGFSSMASYRANHNRSVRLMTNR